MVNYTAEYPRDRITEFHRGLRDDHSSDKSYRYL